MPANSTVSGGNHACQTASGISNNAARAPSEAHRKSRFLFRAHPNTSGVVTASNPRSSGSASTQAIIPGRAAAPESAAKYARKPPLVSECPAVNSNWLITTLRLSERNCRVRSGSSFCQLKCAATFPKAASLQRDRSVPGIVRNPPRPRSVQLNSFSTGWQCSPRRGGAGRGFVILHCIKRVGMKQFCRRLRPTKPETSQSPFSHGPS